MDYYPFGMIMPGRSYSSPAYRYGFNGIEKADEIAGSANHYTAEFGEYDARMGRRWNPDPKPNAALSVYSLFADNPNYYTDAKLDTPSHTPQIGLSEGSPVAELKHGDYFSDVQQQTYTATFSGASKDDFNKLKSQLSLDPGVIINNCLATYNLVDRDGSYGVTVGDHFDIDITDAGSVLVDKVEVSDNYISITVLTLKGHPDAGQNTFTASYDPKNSQITWTTQNISRTNDDVSLGFGGWVVGRPLQKLQWRYVIQQVGSYINKPIISASKTITEFDYNDWTNEIGEQEFTKTKSLMDVVK